MTLAVLIDTLMFMAGYSLSLSLFSTHPMFRPKSNVTIKQGSKPDF